ncbi:23S rRNA methyltransferase [Pseudonocardia sp. TRM90224]|uniref:23S rRNA methyltransferase n=1 Tax=Pseudonocardia sp. TRM90224 TaxID=2812678 RepID=UPI001E4BE213|nr:23S rRNA methyltransferase [Pseudonocardia sp. TRM90224]
MVAARERFLGRDHYRALRSTVTALAVENAPSDPGLIVDLAGGTGHYLAPVVDACPDSWGLTTDLSSAALRRAARAHPRAAAVAADVWRPLPLISESAAVVLSVFGPRPAAEIRRVLKRDGVVIVANALPEHLQELRDLVGTIGVDPRKAERMSEAFRAFERVAHQVVSWRLALDRDDVEAAVAMGPNARHLDPSRLLATAAELPAVVGVSAAMEVTVLRPS